MKKLGLFIASLVLAANAAADGATIGAQPNMALAAAEAGVAMRWNLPENTERAHETLSTQDLERQSQELNEKLDAQLNERLNAKLSQQLQADF